MSTIPAIYEQGVFRPTVPVDLPEGTRVNIPTPEPAPNDRHDARERFLNLIGSIDLGRPIGITNSDIDRDLASEHNR